MNEMLRHLWLHGMEHLATTWLVAAILLLISVGAALRSGYLHALRNRRWREDALIVSASLHLLFLFLLMLMAIIPSSPLRGVTGALMPSPWLHGLYPSLCTISIICSIVYALATGRVNSPRSLLELLTYGITRWPWLILLTMIISTILCWNN